MKQKIKNISIYAGIVISFLFLFTAFSSFINTLLVFPLIHNDQPQNTDVIIVLGAGMKKTGEINKTAQERIKEAELLFDDGFSQNIILAGGKDKKYHYINSEKAEDYALQIGIPKENIFLETKSKNTYENAVFSQTIMQQNNWKSALIVTSDFHTKRSCWIFHKLKMQVKCIASKPNLISPESTWDRLTRFKNIVREYGAMIYFKLKGYI
jgi:uncharacterized SAM-binding protein YcdF (DUF218 family)